jgi:hypothetical protein
MPLKSLFFLQKYDAPSEDMAKLKIEGIWNNLLLHRYEHVYI